MKSVFICLCITCFYFVGCDTSNSSKKISNEKFIMPWHRYYINYNEKGKMLDLNNLYELSIQDINNSKAESIDPYLSIIRKHSKSKEVFYYAVVDTTNYYSVIYKTYSDYEVTYDLVNYSKDYNILSYSTISIAGGDAGFSYYTNSKFINDSIVLSEYVEGNLEDIYSRSAKDKITNHYRLKISSYYDGEIKVDTIH